MQMNFSQHDIKVHKISFDVHFLKNLLRAKLIKNKVIRLESNLLTRKVRKIKIICMKLIFIH